MDTSEPGLVALLRRREACGDRSLARGGRRVPQQQAPELTAAAADMLRGFHPTAPTVHWGEQGSGDATASSNSIAGKESYSYGSRGPARLPCIGPQQRWVPAPGAAAAGPALHSWAEDDFLRHCAASYCPLTPAPRSTIDLDFSHDGRLLASSHGDHTVKITCCATGRCLRVLEGHHRTPWVVRFHQRNPALLASGSLDHQVRLWNVETGECINSHNFLRPIASVAFNERADELAVAAGHKLYMWNYTQPRAAPVASGSCPPSSGGGGQPHVALKTRRSLRAVHFHPHGRPLMLTAEVVADAPSSSTQPAPPVPVIPTDMAQVAPPARLPADALYPPAAHLPSLAQYVTPPEQRAPGAAATQQAAAATDTDGVHPLNQILLSEQTAARRAAARWGPPPSHQQQQQQQQQRSPEWASLRQRLGQRRQAGADGEAPGGEERGPAPQHPGTQPDMQWQVTQEQQRQLDQAEAAHAPAHGPQQLQGLRVRSASAPPGSIPAASWPPTLQHHALPVQALGQQSAGVLTLAAQQQQEEQAALYLEQQRRGQLFQEELQQRQRRQEEAWHLQQQQQQPGPATAEGASRQPGTGPLLIPCAPSNDQASDMEEDAQPPQPARSIPVPVSPVAVRAGAEIRPRHRPPSPPPAGSLAAFTAGAAGSGSSGRSLGEATRQASLEGRPLPAPVGATSCGSSAPPHPPAPASVHQEQATVHRWAAQGRADVLSDQSAGAGLPPLPGSFAALAAPQQQAPVFQQGGGYSRASAQQAQQQEEAQRRQWHAAREVVAAAAAREQQAQRAAAALLRPLPQHPQHQDQQQQEERQAMPWAWGGDGSRAIGAGHPASVSAAAVAAAVAAAAAAAPTAAGLAAAGDASALLQPPHSQETAGASLPLAPSMVAMGWEWPVPGGPVAAQGGPAGFAGFAAAHAAPPANVVGQEQPCRVKLKLWAWREAPGGSGRVPGLAVPAAVIADAVLCSEMGVQFSPCGNLVAACVACPGPLTDITGRAGAAYEVRIYSLAPGGGFGSVLGRRPVKAAHCLTSIQFSPTGELLLLAYGRRHLALLRSLASDGQSIVPVHTILEVVRVSPAMELLRVLPSAEDEVNAAAFHPLPGGGLAYGTKEGRLRLLRTEHGSPRPQPKAAAAPGDGAESPTAPPPPRGMEHNGGDSDDSEDDGGGQLPRGTAAAAAMLAPMSP